MKKIIIKFNNPYLLKIFFIVAIYKGLSFFLKIYTYSKEGQSNI